LQDHTYLNGNYAPVSEENVDVPVEIVEGELPQNLDGMFICNGPNPAVELAFPKRYHWFDWHGMLHNLRIKNGKASYTNQFVPSTRYQIIERELGETFFPTLGEYTCFLG
jgi:carotenoid cleavage dioxygenase-like enzyme